jgi:hypothetical protein
MSLTVHREDQNPNIRASTQRQDIHNGHKVQPLLLKP